MMGAPQVNEAQEILEEMEARGFTHVGPTAQCRGGYACRERNGFTLLITTEPHGLTPTSWVGESFALLLLAPDGAEVQMMLRVDTLTEAWRRAMLYRRSIG